MLNPVHETASAINQLTLNFQPPRSIRSLTRIFLTHLLTSFTDWAPTDPDNWRGNQDCGQIWSSRENQWDDVSCDGPRAYVCEQVCRDLFTLHHNNNKTYGLWPYSLDFPLNTLKVGMVSFSAQQAICALNIWTIEETFLWRETNIIMSLNNGMPWIHSGHPMRLKYEKMNCFFITKMNETVLVHIK